MQNGLAILVKSGYNFSVPEPVAWELPHKVISIKLDELDWSLDLPVWELEGTDDWNLSPDEALKQIPGSKTHYERILSADLKYLIIVTTKEGRFFVVDGFHRLAKMKSQNKQEIKVKLVKYNLIKNYERNLTIF